MADSTREKQNRPHCSFPMTAFKVNTKTLTPFLAEHTLTL